MSWIRYFILKLLCQLVQMQDDWMRLTVTALGNNIGKIDPLNKGINKEKVFW